MSESTCDKMLVADYTIYQLLPDGSRNKIWATVYTDRTHAAQNTVAAKRLAACWNVCEGISTEVLELNATAGGIATLERQRDNYRAALEGAAYRDLDGMGTNRPIDSRRIGEEAKLSTLAIITQRDQLLAALNSLILFTKPAKFNAVALNHAHQTIAAVTGGKEPVVHPAVAQRNELLAALNLYEESHSALFAQCCSNPITNAWGKPVDMTSFNLAHEAASSAIKKASGGGV